jgi:CBS domain-containing protein
MEQNAKTICVKDIMTKNVISVDSSVTVKDAAQMMEDTKVGAIVVTENNTPIGILTDRDFTIKIAAHEYPLTTPVKQVMSHPLYSITPGESVWMIADFMYSIGIRKLPVIDDNQLVGIVTATDVVNQFANATEDKVRRMFHHSLAKIYS